MSKILIAIIIGVSAGIVDIIPMIIQKLDKRDTISAFIHYFALGIIIPFVDWGIPLWATGIIVSFLTAVPLMIIVFKSDKKAVIPMIVFSIILGAAIGFCGELFIHN